LHYQLDDAAFEQLFNDFIVLCDKKKNVYDADIVALIEHRATERTDLWKLVRFQASGGTRTIATATVELQFGKQAPRIGIATGDGPIDALFKVLCDLTGVQAAQQDYQVRSISTGEDAQAEVHVTLTHSQQPFHGLGVSTDTLEATALAYISALNKIAATEPGE
jgi:2-isopropylmalate synthase